MFQGAGYLYIRGNMMRWLMDEITLLLKSVQKMSNQSMKTTKDGINIQFALFLSENTYKGEVMLDRCRKEQDAYCRKTLKVQ